MTKVACCGWRWSGGVISISSAFRLPLWCGVSGTLMRTGSLEYREGVRREDRDVRGRVGVAGVDGICCKEDGPASGPCVAVEVDADDGRRMLLRCAWFREALGNVAELNPFGFGVPEAASSVACMLLPCLCSSATPPARIDTGLSESLRVRGCSSPPSGTSGYTLQSVLRSRQKRLGGAPSSLT